MSRNSFLHSRADTPVTRVLVVVLFRVFLFDSLICFFGGFCCCCCLLACFLFCFCSFLCLFWVGFFVVSKTGFNIPYMNQGGAGFIKGLGVL